jgi:hypothetical protein
MFEVLACVLEREEPHAMEPELRMAFLTSTAWKGTKKAPFQVFFWFPSRSLSGSVPVFPVGHQV